MNRKQSPANILQQVPKKWAVAIIVALIGYALLQPLANSRLGWNLPSAAGLLGQEGSQGGQVATGKQSSGTSKTDPSRASKSDSVAQPNKPPAKKSSGSESAGGNSAGSNSSGSNPAESNDAGTGSTTVASAAEADSSLKYGVLRDLGREEYMSPGGLKYTRGSQEGHRLKHLERHLEDQPTRPGKHGVFYGDMPQVLRWLDETYTRGREGGRGTSAKTEDDRTVYEVTFEKPIGFVGGRDGGRSGNPDAKRVRLVVEGNRVITAFPF